MFFFNYFTSSLLLFFLGGCSGLEKSESKKQRQVNLVVQPIKRKSTDHFFDLRDPKPTQNQEVYPWQKNYTGKIPRITKEFFRCKGNVLNPPLRIASETQQITYQIDCGGLERHSLPIQNGKEYIYPILIDLLNHIQEKTGKRVVITSGHRCPIHNRYVDPSKKNRVSKHLMGAEVDFFVEGMEYDPLSLIEILESYYKDKPLINKQNHWMNSEVVITCHSIDEPRNGDNQHKYPYLTIELRIPFSWQLGYNGFYRSG